MGEESQASYRRTIGKCRIVVAILVLALVVVIVAFAVALVRLHNKLAEKQGHMYDACPASSQKINTGLPAKMTPFHDLTAEEVAAVQKFLYEQDDLHLVRPANINCSLSYIYTMELQPPVKEQALRYLDKGGKMPDREAKVVVFHGSEANPDIKEYIVGPLPAPSKKKMVRSVPFKFRPSTGPELADAIPILKNAVHSKIKHILKESYDAGILECGNRCIDIKIVSAMSPAFSGQPDSRKWWFWLSQDVEFFSLNPIDLEILMDLTAKSPANYSIEKVVYGGKAFDSLQELADAYASNKVTKTKIPFPESNKNLFSSLNRRGDTAHPTQQQAPVEVEPNGARYSIDGRKISYLPWDFHVRMSTISGPQLYDVRFNGKRLAYEISLQELAVFYSADNPQHRFADYVDSAFLLGMRSRGLVPGVDCPKHATFLSTSHVIESSGELVTYDRALCVFEHNTGMPLRRHLSSVGETGKFFEGVQDIVLTVRAVITAINYDYILDFIFHQNGVINVKITSAGYILTSFRFPSEDAYGWRLGDHITGNIHHHLFHFKVDLDINGESNRFETLDLEAIEADNTMWSVEKNATYSMTKLVPTLRHKEKAAALKYDFNAPKYLSFYNDGSKTGYGVPRSYRIFMAGMSKQMIAEGQGQEPSVAWGRYQLAVTKRRENETRSSSMYAIWDALEPVVNFQDFINDNDDIVDQDLVAWVTMGIHHIPHMEDIPVTHTVGLERSFFLIPHNYFDEDPAMASGDAVRIEPKDQRDLSQGVSIERYGQTENAQCAAPPTTFDQDVEDNPQLLFDPYVPGQI